MRRWAKRVAVAAAVAAAVASARAEEKLPPRVDLKQAPARSRGKLELPKGSGVGPTLPGLAEQEAVPQGLAFWEDKSRKWLLVSFYFDDGRPSVVAALDAKSNKLVKCLTLVDPGGKGHTGHVGGLAVSDKFLWVGSGQLYRVPLADVLAAKPVDYLHLEKPFKTESRPSYVAYHDKRVWVGEFTTQTDPNLWKGNPDHHLEDRTGARTHAWVCGYALDAKENLVGAADGKLPPPSAILGVRDEVQGMAFLDGRVVLSVSAGRKKYSTLVAYTNPVGTKSHAAVKVGDKKVPVWFLDGKNHSWDVRFPPMVEGVAAYGDGLAVISESGAKKQLKDGLDPLDSVVFVPLPTGK